MAYLDGTGLTHFWNKLKQTFLSLNDVADYVTECYYSETDADWSYRKWANGAAECWGRFPVTFANIYVLQNVLTFPFSFALRPSVTATINDAGNNQSSAFQWNVKAVQNTEVVDIYLQDSNGGFSSGSVLYVSVHVFGRLE